MRRMAWMKGLRLAVAAGFAVLSMESYSAEEPVTIAEEVSVDSWVSPEYPWDGRLSGKWSNEAGDGFVAWIPAGANQCLFQMDGRIQPGFRFRVKDWDLIAILRESTADGMFKVDVYRYEMEEGGRLMLSMLVPDSMDLNVRNLKVLAQRIGGCDCQETMFGERRVFRRI